jgi:hypothetical protein
MKSIYDVWYDIIALLVRLLKKYSIECIYLPVFCVNFFLIIQELQHKTQLPIFSVCFQENLSFVCDKVSNYPPSVYIP